MTRPKRLWVVVLVNVAVGVLTLAALGFLFAKSLPIAGTVILTFVPSVLICGVLITSSIFAFFRLRPVSVDSFGHCDPVFLAFI